MVGRNGMVRRWRLVLLAWVPIVVGEGMRSMFGLPPDPTLFDLSIHARVLVALPVLLSSARLVDAACNSAIQSLYNGDLCPRPSIDTIVKSGKRLRDARWPEVGLLMLAVAGGQFALWQISGAAGLVHGGTGMGAWSFPRVWYAVVALPLVLFVTYRWFWHWVIWAVMLAHFARQPLTPIATHPDLTAGLSCVSRPVSAFGGFAFALGAVLAGAWGTQILRDQTTLEALYPELLAFLLIMLTLAVAPLFPFTRHLYRVRRRELARYGDFASNHVRAFHAKWVLSRATGAESLGTPDIQSLSDLGNAFGVITRTRLVPFSLRQLVTVWSSALLPMLPLFASVLTVRDLLARIVTLILRGLPV
jgi:hypothetical protein